MTSPPLTLSLPPQICADIPGTWAYETMTRRILHGECGDKWNMILMLTGIEQA